MTKNSSQHLDSRNLKLICPDDISSTNGLLSSDSQDAADGSVRKGMRGYWITTFVLAGLSLIALSFDRTLSEPDNLQHLPGDLKRFVSLSELFAHGFGIAVVGLGIWLLVKEKRRFIPRIIMCAAWPPMAVHLVKMMVGRNRPINYFEEDKIAHYPVEMTDSWVGLFPRNEFNLIYDTQSFPSGHTATAWGLAIGLSWVFPKGRWLFFGIALLASIQRVTSFAHWSSDVFAGAAIAFMMAGALTHNWGFGYYFGKFENRKTLAAESNENELLEKVA